MARLVRGSKLVCVPSGREIVVTSKGVSCTTIWCCRRPMKKKETVSSKRKSKRVKR